VRQPDRRAHRSRVPAPGPAGRRQSAPDPITGSRPQQGGGAIAGAPAKAGAHRNALDQGQIAPSSGRCNPGGRRASAARRIRLLPSRRQGRAGRRPVERPSVRALRANSSADPGSASHYRQLVENRRAAGRALPGAGLILGRGLERADRPSLAARAGRVSPIQPAGPGVSQAMGSARARWARSAVQQKPAPRGYARGRFGVTVTPCAAAAQPPPWGDGQWARAFREAGVGAGQPPPRTC